MFKRIAVLGMMLAGSMAVFTPAVAEARDRDDQRQYERREYRVDQRDQRNFDRRDRRDQRNFDRRDDHASREHRRWDARDYRPYSYCPR